MRSNRGFLQQSVCVTIFAGLAACVYACGSDSSSSAILSDDGGAEGSTDDGAMPAVDGSQGIDSGGGKTDSGGGAMDAGGPCPIDGVACLVNGATAGLCKSGACTSCADPTDDAKCTTAYGSAAKPYICNAGTCQPGDCRKDADCKFGDGGTDGQICGLSTPNKCGKCTQDSQCTADANYGPSTMCNPTTGQCVSSTCAAVTAPPTACTANATDICCPGAAASNVCTHGTNCCSSADCSGMTPNCNAGTCGACAAPAPGGPYLVDPSTATDAGRTGNGAACAFKSIKAALDYVASLKLAVHATIKVEGTAALGTATGETFPIAIPAGVTITGDSAMAPTILVPAAQVGFTMSAPDSVLSTFTVDGQSNTAQQGLVVATGSDATTKIDHVVVKNMLGDGIGVGDAAGQNKGGVLAIGYGVSSTGNGTALARANGLTVNGHGAVTVTGQVGADKTSFDSNTQSGIAVTGLGKITLTGDVGATPPTTSTVTANGNYGAGVLIANTPGAPPSNALTGLAAWNTTLGSGLVLTAGSAVKVRAGSFLGNTDSGARVTEYNDGVMIVDDVTLIDLGASAAGDPGLNVLQAPIGMSPNKGVGLCLAIAKNKGQQLTAAGNTFAQGAAFVDCSKNPANPALTHNVTCTLGVDVSVLGPAANSDVILTAGCTQP
jgi:hypothetical protein